MAFEIHRGVNISHWLSQSKRRGAERAAYFGRDDVALIAEMGFDHLRIPVDEEQMWRADGRAAEEAFDLLEAGLDWCEQEGLPAIVDLHILRSHYFNDAEIPPLWTDPDQPERFAELWRQMSRRLGGRGNDRVAYELLNEAVAPDDEAWNRVWAHPFAAIREAEPRRTILLGSNRFNSPERFDALDIPDDEHCILTFHFYSPMLITHYTASWWRQGGAYAGPVRYPGTPIPPADFDALTPARQDTLRDQNEPFGRDAMARRIAQPLAARRRTGRPIYCGEFGSLDTIDRVDESIRPAWFADVISLFEEHDIPWAVWDYGKGGFGVLDKSGRPNRLVEIMTGRA